MYGVAFVSPLYTRSSTFILQRYELQRILLEDVLKEPDYISQFSDKMTSKLPPWSSCKIIDYFYCDSRSIETPFNFTVKALLWARIKANEIIVCQEYELEVIRCRCPVCFLGPFWIRKTLGVYRLASIRHFGVASTSYRYWSEFLDFHRINNKIFQQMLDMFWLICSYKSC